MSVFNDFQRLWMQRFPQSSLSDAWEQDVRASLERHKFKITELTKELEQETLYVEYLERLLLDVEKFRETGGDPTTLFEAATTTVNNATSPQHCDAEGCTDNGQADVTTNVFTKSSLNLREANNESKDKTNRLSLNTDNKYASNNNQSTSSNSNVSGNGGSSSGSGSGIGVGVVAGSGSNKKSTPQSSEEQSYEKEDKDVGTEKETTNERNGALHAQCITELAATITANQSVDKQQQARPTDEQQNGTNKIVHHKLKSSLSMPSASASSTTSSSSSTSTSSTSTSQFITRIEIKESKINNEKDMVGTIEETEYENSTEAMASTTNTFTSFERKPTAPPLSPALTTSPAMSSSSYVAHLESKNKKMPPRPPPKNIRRVEPPTIPGPLSSSPKRDSPFVGSTMPLPSNSTNSFTTSSVSPGNSLERNIKPSDIYRQKPAESYMSNRKTTTDMSKFANTPELIEELGRKVGKSESLEKTKRSEMCTTQSPTGSLGRMVTTTTSTTTTSRNITPATLNAAKTSPTGSLSKTTQLATAESSSTGSLDKKSRSSLQTADTGADINARNVVGSKESLASQGISEIIKSYESVSSLSSDSAKAPQQIETEPYYDSVPLDNGDGEYVYIKPGRAGSSSSRDDLSTAGSTLPMGTTAHLSSQASVTDPESPGRTNYVNIDYFLQQNNETRSSSIDSDGEYDGPPIMRTISHDEQTSQTPGALRKSSNNARGAKIRSILTSIIQSETIYVECLNKMIQYKRAIHATIGTSKPVINEEDENTIFFNIEELFNQHTAFLNDLKAIVAIEGGDVLIGDAFKRLADMFEVYTAFLHNYNQAIETVKKCSASNTHFKEIVSTIVLNLQTEQSLTLEDLLHKPVARVQIIALVFNDLLRETPSHHRDYLALQDAQKTIHRVLQEFKVGSQSNNLRRMVKNSFIVELVDGHRKLRHLFLFHDVLACAKYKASGRDRFEYELKWFIPVKDVHVETDTTIDLKEASPANIMQLKSHACSTRSQLLTEEKEKNGVRAGDKLRRRLAELETQLVLASPNLVFRLGNKANNKPYTFFLSSDFERTQWIDSILTLQQSYNLPSANVINTLEMRALIVAIPKLMKTEMGSYLMRDTKDESLLVGDLYLSVQGLAGLKQLADLYVCLEVDSYGHYFRKATTKMVCRSMNPMWNESFVLELDGSQNVRVLLYEAQERPMLKAKHVLKLSRSWLKETEQSKVLKMGETLTLNIVIRFVHGNYRVPTSKPGVLFGVKMSQVLKREKRNIPFIISACIREVEHRGLSEVGVYRVSGSASDLAKLKKSFETNAFEAEQLLKDVDIHSVTGILKSYLRELPEALFTDLLYPKFFDTFNAFSNNNETARINELLKVFEELPQPNKESINLILDHLIRVHNKEADNKMSLHNLAMVFGPTLLRPGQQQAKQKDILASSTVDVMAQAGILYCFLQARIRKD